MELIAKHSAGVFEIEFARSDSACKHVLNTEMNLADNSWFFVFLQGNKGDNGFDGVNGEPVRFSFLRFAFQCSV